MCVCVCVCVCLRKYLEGKVSFLILDKKNRKPLGVVVLHLFPP